MASTALDSATTAACARSMRGRRPLRWSALRTRAISSGAWNGLRMTSSAPASRAATRWSYEVRSVSARMGSIAVRWSARRRRTSSTASTSRRGEGQEQQIGLVLVDRAEAVLAIGKGDDAIARILRTASASCRTTESSSMTATRKATRASRVASVNAGSLCDFGPPRTERGGSIAPVRAACEVRATVRGRGRPSARDRRSTAMGATRPRTFEADGAARASSTMRDGSSDTEGETCALRRPSPLPSRWSSPFPWPSARPAIPLARVGYHDYAEMYGRMRGRPRPTHPGIVRVFSIGRAPQGRAHLGRRGQRQRG